MGKRILASLIVLVAGSCSERPKAPPLVAEPVYQNDDVGLRFLVPQGWPLQSRAILPRGPLPRAIVLVAYARSGGGWPAEFKVLVADLPSDTDLAKFLTEYRVGREEWTLAEPPKNVVVNGTAATRLVLARREGNEEIRREAMVFRRGERCFFFLLTCPSSEPTTLDLVRSSIESITWSN